MMKVETLRVKYEKRNFADADNCLHPPRFYHPEIVDMDYHALQSGAARIKTMRKSHTFG